MPDPIRLTILHTNDLHGRVPPLMRIATLVRQIRREVKAAGGYCLYLDAGDSEDTTLLESSLTKGSSMNTLLRGAGCDYVALGNSIPGRYGPQAIAGMAQAFGRPLLCANFLDQNDQLVEGLEPFAIHGFGTFAVGLPGLTAVTGVIGKVYETVFGLHPKQPEEVLPEMLQKIREAGAQTVILLSHLALDEDKRVAKTVPGIDVIIGGHSHDALEQPLEINGTVIAQAGDFGHFLGRLDLEIDSISGRVTQFEGSLLPIEETILPDPKAKATTKAEQQRVQAIMGHVIGTLSTPFDHADNRECAAGNLLADALLERVDGTEVALVLAGHWETGLKAGPLTQGQLFGAIRSTANPAKLELTGEQIEQFLRSALQLENALKSPHELRGKKIGMPHVARMTVRYDPSNLERLEIHVTGQPLEKNRKYVVASTDMEFADWIGYLVIPDEQIEYEVPTIMPEVLDEYIAKRSPLQTPAIDRIRI